jgi:ZIP family zinc transporter
LFLAVAIATFAVLLGLLLGLAPAASRRALGPLRTLALTAVIGVVALHLLPEALRDLGAIGLVVFAGGLSLPRWLSLLRGPHSHRTSGELGLDLGFLGLLVHHLGDGLALGAYSRPDPASGSSHSHPHTDVLLALVLHTVPLVAVVAAGYARARGVRSAVSRCALLALASVVGVLGSHSVPAAIVGSATAWIAAGVSGLLLHGLAHDLGRDLPRAPLGRSLDLAMAVLGIAVGVFGAKLGAHADPAGEARLRLAIVTELDRTALPLAAGLVLGAALTLSRNPKLLGGYARAATANRGGVLTPEAFLLTLSHFGFLLALLRDLLSAIGLSLRGAPGDGVAAAEGAEESPEPASAGAALHPVSAGLFERVDVIVPWAALGLLVSAVIRASVPDFALECPLWVALLAAVAFALSVRLHAVAAPSLAFALADRGLPLAAALVVLILSPFALDLRKAKHWLFIAIPSVLALLFADRVPRNLLMADSEVATVAAACIGVVLLMRAYQLGFRGLLLPLVRAE